MITRIHFLGGMAVPVGLRGRQMMTYYDAADADWQGWEVSVEAGRVIFRGRDGSVVDAPLGFCVIERSGEPAQAQKGKR